MNEHDVTALGCAFHVLEFPHHRACLVTTDQTKTPLGCFREYTTGDIVLRDAIRAVLSPSSNIADVYWAEGDWTEDGNGASRVLRLRGAK